MENTIGEHTISKLEIPTVFHESKDVIDKELANGNYDVVLSIGQAGGRYDLTPERVGINIDDARIPDNKGNRPIDVAIQEDGAPAYFSNLPVKTMTEAIKAEASLQAYRIQRGTFVCNHVLYQLGYLADKSYPGLLFGFIHVPFIPEQVTDKPENHRCLLKQLRKV